MTGITASVIRDRQTSLPASSVIRIVHTCVVRPSASLVARQVTQPSRAARIWLALISSPTTIFSAGSTASAPAIDATVSASATEAPPIDDFHRLSRDLYVPVADTGFWQGAFRDPNAEEFGAAHAAVRARDPLTIDVLYGDHEGGQRVISRFTLNPREDGEWIAAVARHWNIDRPDPR